jgi:hypothetical protein
MGPQMPPVMVSPYLRLPLRPLGEVRRLRGPIPAQPVVVNSPRCHGFDPSDASDWSCVTPS